jgi:predicted small lipoprotein YifL
MKKQHRILGSIAKPLAACMLLGTLLLSACGQKGPLYLPSPDQGASSASPGAKANNTP